MFCRGKCRGRPGSCETVGEVSAVACADAIRSSSDAGGELSSVRRKAAGSLVALYASKAEFKKVELEDPGSVVYNHKSWSRTIQEKSAHLQSYEVQAASLGFLEE